MSQQKFQENAIKTFDRVKAVFTERAGQYGDTWRNCQFLTMKAVASRLGLSIPDPVFRALATAAFCDMKYQRLEGGYKDDSIVDGINYNAYLAQEMQDLIAQEMQKITKI